MGAPNDPPRPLTEELAAAVPLTLFSAAVAAGFARVFAGWQFLDNLLVLVIGGHGLSLLLRRARLPGIVALPIVAIALGWAIGAMHYRFTYSYLLPTSDTWNLFTSELDLVREQFRTAVAPVIYGAGWDVLASIGVAAVVLLADAFAFRAYARAEALVPGGVLFVFIAALGDDRDRIALSMLLVGTGVLATAMLRAYHARRYSAIGGRFSGTRLAAPSALGAAIVISLAAGVVGPALPGANAEPIYDTAEGGGSSSSIVSPLVDIRSRLTNRSDVELFVVESSHPRYWRTAALAAFDGRRWEIPDRELQAAPTGGPIPTADEGEVRQRVTVAQLGGSFVPAAADPWAVQGAGDLEVGWVEEDATLFTRDRELSAGDTIDILSVEPLLEGADLTTVTSDDPGDTVYTELPPDYPDLARELAAQVTAGATSTYQTALMLQDWFQDPDEFSYSLEVQSGHGSNAIESFLRERVGYCEQFAGTYASMLRTLGIPTRVSVGFTMGREETAGTYSVRGKNAHSWPEVWFDDIGWVLFEPTPGRGAPGTGAYTRLPAAQDESATEATAPPETAEPPPTSAGEPNQPQRELNIPPEDLFGLPPDGSSPPEPTGGGGLPIVPTIAVILLILVAPAVARWLARRRPGSAEEQLGRSWQRAVRALSDVGVRHDPTDTPMEAADRVAERFPVAARATRSLAEALTTAVYRRDGWSQIDNPGPYGQSTLRDCANWSRQIERAAADSTSVRTRVVRYFTRWR